MDNKISVVSLIDTTTCDAWAISNIVFVFVKAVATKAHTWQQVATISNNSYKPSADRVDAIGRGDGGGASGLIKIATVGVVQIYSAAANTEVVGMTIYRHQ